MYVCSQILKFLAADSSTNVGEDLHDSLDLEFSEGLGSRSSLKVRAHVSHARDASKKQEIAREEPVFVELDLELASNHKGGTAGKKVRVFRGVLASGKSIFDTNFSRTSGRLSDGVELQFLDPSCDLDDELCEREFKNQSVEDILSTVLGERGWSVNRVGSRNPKIDSVMLEEGDTAWTFSERLVKPLGLFLNFEHGGSPKAKSLRLLSPDFTAAAHTLHAEEIMGSIEVQFRPSSFVDEVIAGDFSGGVRKFVVKQFESLGAGPEETQKFRKSSGLFTSLRKRLMNSTVGECGPDLIEGVFLERMLSSYSAVWNSSQFLDIGSLVSLEPLKAVSKTYTGTLPFLIVKRVSRYSDSSSTWHHSYIGMRP